MELWFNVYNMRARHEANFGFSVSFGKDYLYFGLSLWFFNWDIHIACSRKEKPFVTNEVGSRYSTK